MYKNRKGYFYTLLLYNKKYFLHIGKNTKNVKAVLCNFENTKKLFVCADFTRCATRNKFCEFWWNNKKEFVEPFGLANSFL